jgi:hypothetical protein
MNETEKENAINTGIFYRGTSVMSGTTDKETDRCAGLRTSARLR